MSRRAPKLRELKISSNPLGGAGYVASSWLTHSPKAPGKHSNLLSENLVSKFAFKWVNAYRYTSAPCPGG
jgi:hypothetical protein